MEIKELVKKYRISQHKKFTKEQGFVYENTILIRNAAEAKEDHMIDEIQSKKSEIISYFEEKRAAEKKAYEDRQQKISEIEGLDVIQAAKEDVLKWHKEFNQSFDDVGGMGVRPFPKYDFEALYKKYPVARAYLKASGYANKTNVELSIIGEKALECIINNPEEYESALENMEKELKEFTEKHMWD